MLEAVKIDYSNKFLRNFIALFLKEVAQKVKEEKISYNIDEEYSIYEKYKKYFIKHNNEYIELLESFNMLSSSKSSNGVFDVCFDKILYHYATLSTGLRKEVIDFALNALAFRAKKDIPDLMQNVKGVQSDIEVIKKTSFARDDLAIIDVIVESYSKLALDILVVVYRINFVADEFFMYNNDLRKITFTNKELVSKPVAEEDLVWY